MNDQSLEIKRDLNKASSLDQLILEAEKYSLTGSDLTRMTNHKTNVLTYSDLDKFDSFDDFLVDNTAIVLFQLQQNVGHWISVIRKGRTIEIFDPYGMSEEESLSHSDFNLRQHNGKIISHLKGISNIEGYKVIENRTRLQRLKEGINTCGRYCVLRIKWKHLNLKKFVRLFSGNHENNDFLVSALTLLD